VAELRARPWVRRGATGLAVVAVLGGGGYAAWAAHADGPSGYRTATATRADVTSTLALSGTVTPLGRSDLQFATSGTVRSAVAVGTHVRRGQVVAQLATDDLQAAVTEAQAKVDSATARLASDQSAEEAQEEAAAAAAKASAAAAAAQQKAQQQAQKQGQSGGGDPVALAEQACATSGSSGSSGSAGSSGAPSSSASSAPTSLPTSGTGSSPSRGASAAGKSKSKSSTGFGGSGGGSQGSKSGKGAPTAMSCSQALAAVQQYVAGLDKQLQQLGSSQGSGSTGGSSGSSGSRGSGTSGLSGASGATVTAATLASDQADIDQAEATLVAAKASLRGATLRAPAAGTVAQVDLAVGDTASTGSTAVTILGKGVTTVTIAASSTQVAELKAGQSASVEPAGAAAPLAATVTRISTVPGSDSSSTTTYPVTVTLARTDLSLLAGATAAVDVTVGTAHDVLTVPTSAVSNGAVEVLRDGTPTTVRVTTGVVGPTRTQVTGGVSEGDQVVLADLSESVPTSTNQDSTRGFGGGGSTGGFGGTLTGGFGGTGRGLSGFTGSAQGAGAR
jgi:multidrug efflux pump subunit AcrA (membrane-fusion protein)